MRRLLVLAGCLSACAAPATPAPEYGVSLDLARDRAKRVRAVEYDLRFRIPAVPTEPVTGGVTLEFTLSSPQGGLALDFRGDSTAVEALVVNGTPADPVVTAGHILLAAAALREGSNRVSLRFRSGDDALNRDDEFLYALFVPDRAATAFPAFDQPDLKGRYRLELEVPAGWRALSNGAELVRDSSEAGVTVRFGPTEPISSYLFAFAAGRFQVEEAVRDGRTFTMLHRETDSARVVRNRDQIFDLHAAALRWLEEYTGIPYPFGKFAFLAVPSFQFGGMEHPGAVWYRASSLFLEPTATRNQVLGRASLIAHETAHMWFGDLVTMRWFSDVWMKEVFANFMAAKIVQPSFPDINHDLRFLLAHFPSAYGVDRTLGANPIRQELGNLRDAGSLYGAIIYQKAPIVMRHLERLVGDSVFRDGLREYLSRHRFGNAEWPNLITILDSLSTEDLRAWSRAWVEEPFRPTIETRWSDGQLVVRQHDPLGGRGLRWVQTLDLALGYPESVDRVTVRLVGDSAVVAVPERPRWVLPGADGLGYGRFPLDSAGREVLLEGVAGLGDPLLRSAAWMALGEEVLSGALPPDRLLQLALGAVGREPDDLITQQLLGLIRNLFWRYLPETQRAELAPGVEAALWRGLDRAQGAGAKGAWWGAVTGVTTTAEGTARLYRIWKDRRPPAGLPLAEQQYTALAEGLALRMSDEAETILDEELGRITNPDRQARLQFVRPALSPDPGVRDSLFRSFAVVENRRRESWVLDAMGWLSHPLRAREAERWLDPGLELVEEIQRTGDIFFPLNWLNALLDGHQSVAAAEAVERYLAGHPELPPRLRGKVLQAADDLWRAARIVEGWRGPAHNPSFPALTTDGPGA